MRIAFAIDRGGTFTDCIAHYQDVSGWRVITEKLLSQDPRHYEDASREGIRRLLERVTGQTIPRPVQIPTECIESVRLGTTIATNALLERKGERCALVITKGFKDLLIIGNQSRPDIFDLAIRVPDQLYEHVVQVDERVTVLGASATGQPAPPVAGDLVQGVSGDVIQILQRPDATVIKRQLQNVWDKGIRSIAICLLHAHTFQDHEQLIASIAHEIGFSYVFTSSPIMRIVPRAHSTVANAYLTPKLRAYMDSFVRGFDTAKDPDFLKRVYFMKSDGGLSDISSIKGSEAVVSGPAGGVVGYARTTWNQKERMPVIGFDMGGTSTDVSRFDGNMEQVFETNIAGVVLQTPQLDIQTVAAGGGSCLTFKNGLFVVGPESAGAHPGPACYRKGGPLTVTDANLMLGRLQSDEFPHIFGPDEHQPLDVDIVHAKFEELARTINAHSKDSMTVEQVAMGFIQIANESMCRPVRNLTEAKGQVASRHILACFGGAGGQHACAIAKILGIQRIVLHKFAPILSAYGLALADVVVEAREPCSGVLADSITVLQERAAHLIKKVRHGLKKQEFDDTVIETRVYLNLHYHGTDTALMVPCDDWETVADAFTQDYHTQFGFTLDRAIRVDDIRVTGVGKTAHVPFQCPPSLEEHTWTPVNTVLAKRVVPVYFEHIGSTFTPVYDLNQCAPFTVVDGPALLLDAYRTVLVEPHCKAFLTDDHIVIQVSQETMQGHVGIHTVNPVLLTVFGHRFMGIAEQMGESLRKTAVSTNVKERLDFSCALFGPDGSLIANAPHIPVHLGSLSHAVRFQLDLYKDDLEDGDILLTNHPMAGGSHLPDMTIITPIYADGKIAFFTASRAHHADIGGILPGSMPPHSKYLYEEGASIVSLKIVKQGVFQQDALYDALVVKPAQYPGCSGTRNYADNVSDIKAQIAANQRGSILMTELMDEYGLEVVQLYMTHIRTNAEMAVRHVLRESANHYSTTLEAVDYMDDGSPICLKVDIDPTQGSATFDFTNSGPQVLGNWNAPPSVVYSAIIYCLRCLVNQDIPLNQGCLVPINVRIPPGSLLSPSNEAAVVGGNVLTSQRLVDVILRAFHACAASQGDCNNFTFGVESRPDRNGWGYYETIAGGSGAGPTWHGKSGVHTHMTNTRITDPEVLEHRYPVILHEFSLRDGSGGRGRWQGGDGVVRHVEFCQDNIQVSLLTERRVFQPYGMDGGQDGARGLNLWQRGDLTINVGGKNSFMVHKGDHVTIYTPGGGGFGAF